MPPNRSQWLLLLLLLLLAPVPALRASAQQPPAPVFNAAHFGDRVPLNQDWLFHTGDNPAYASPTFDDSGWTRINLRKPLADYGVPPDTKFGWMRLHILIPPDRPAPVLDLYNTQGRYQVFVNGQRIGAFGDMRKHDLYRSQVDVLFPIPARALGPPAAQGRTLVLALRWSLQRPTYGGPPPAAPLQENSAWLGTRRALTQNRSAFLLQQVPPAAADVIPGLVTGIMALTLFFAMRDRREYLFLALYCLADAASDIQNIFMLLHPRQTGWVIVSSLTWAPYLLALAAFVRQLAGGRSWLLFSLPIVITTLYALPQVLYATGFLPDLHYVAVGLVVVMYLGLLVLLIRAWGSASAAKRRDLALVLFGISCNAATFFFDAISSACHVLFPALVARFPGLGATGVLIGAFWFSYDTFSDILLTLCLLIFLIQRTVRIARERNQAAAEFAAAQSVQQVLLPEHAPDIPGFRIESVYRPAGEVGGDFFQVLPLEDGGVLVVIGDVSGKGMPAAMTVALLVGTLRTAAEYTQSPAALLAAVNQRLVGRGSGFTTCLAMHLRPDGMATLANAGHLQPYLDGEELPTQPGLPLGLLDGAAYEEASLRLAPGSQLTLLTDGVVEACNPDGELFGFEHAQSIARQSAEAIAQAGAAFGQNDDITVLTVALA